MKLNSGWGKHNLEQRLTKANNHNFSKFSEISTHSHSLGFKIWNMPGVVKLKHEDAYCIFLFFLISLIVVHVYILSSYGQ